MKNNILIFIFILQSVLTVGAQQRVYVKANIPENIILDSSKVETFYDHKVYDPILKESKIFHFILEIGDAFSKYSDTGRYRRDSIILNLPDISDYEANEYFRIMGKYRNNPSSATKIFKDRVKQQITVFDFVPFSTYCYDEPFPQFEWILQDDTLTVCEHLCSKATTKFRGRDWTAWYSEDIPEDNGPWKFEGLPGLILKVEDRDKEHVFEAIMIRNSNMAIRRDKGDSFFNTSRKQMIKQMNEYHEDSGKYTGSKIKSINGKPQVQEKPQRKFYNQIERE